MGDEVRVVITEPALAERTITAWFADRTLDEVLPVVCTVVVAECSVDGGVVTMEPGLSP